MVAKTPNMEVGIEFTKDNSANVEANGKVESKELQNVDFGIIERPDVNITIDKKITSLEVVSQTGASIIPEGNPSEGPSEVNAQMQGVKMGLDGEVPAEIESDLLQGAKLNIKYTITVHNKSQKDYTDENNIYYYYGRVVEGADERTTKVEMVVDYLDATLNLDSTKDNDDWTITTAEDLISSGLIKNTVYEEIKNGDYIILKTEEFNDVPNGGKKDLNLYATKTLAISKEIDEVNHVEIIKLSGGRTIKGSIPGNYNPSLSPSALGYTDENDDDKVHLIITPPTGTTTNYTAYIIAGTAMFAILIVGIIIIKKKVIK